MDSKKKEEGDEQKKDLNNIIDLAKNKELLEKKRKELNEIHKSAAAIKEEIDKECQDVKNQGEKVDEKIDETKK